MTQVDAYIGKCHLTQVRPVEATRYIKGNKIATKINRYISQYIIRILSYKTFSHKVVNDTVTLENSLAVSPSLPPCLPKTSLIYF